MAHFIEQSFDAKGTRWEFAYRPETDMPVQLAHHFPLLLLGPGQIWLKHMPSLVLCIFVYLLPVFSSDRVREWVMRLVVLPSRA